MDHKLLEHLFEFNEPNEVYIMMALARKKNNPELKSEEAVSREIVKRPEEFKYKLNRLVRFVETFEHKKAKPQDFNFYITFNPRNSLLAYHNFKKELVELDKQLMINTTHTRLNKIDKLWFDCLQRPTAKKRRQYFNVDVDTQDEDVLDQAIKLIEKEGELSYVQKTRHGWHILIKPAHYKELIEYIESMGDAIELHRDLFFYIGKLE